MSVTRNTFIIYLAKFILFFLSKSIVIFEFCIQIIRLLGTKLFFVFLIFFYKMKLKSFHSNCAVLLHQFKLDSVTRKSKTLITREYKQKGSCNRHVCSSLYGTKFSVIMNEDMK